VRVTLVASSLTAPGEEHLLTSIRINDSIAIDSGPLGYAVSSRDHARIQHLFLSHSHADHIASLPIFIENRRLAGQSEVPHIYGHAAVLESLRRDVFNDRIWPDYFRLSATEGPFLQLHELAPEVPLAIDGVRLTPVLVNHPVPTYGFVVEDGNGSVAIATDTGPTHRLWEVAQARGNLRWVFLDAAFPEAQAELARISGHLTPRMFALEMQKVAPGPRFVAVHVKAPYRAQVERELMALARPDLELGVPGRAYPI
jgi:ribonuclease BN (tRNA processing enzyme)